MIEDKRSNDKIKVLFITSLLDEMGGAEKNICDVVLNIDRSKFIPYVLAFKGGELLDRLQAYGIAAKENGITKIISVYSIKKGIEIYNFIKQEKINVVVTYHHDADIWGSIIARLSGVPVVISSRRDMGYQLSMMHIWFYRIFSFLFDSFISVSDAVKKETEKREWIRPEKIETVHNGLKLEHDPETYDIQRIKKKFGVSVSKIVIGMVASFRPIKGQIYLVEAVNRIVTKYNNIQIIFVGYTETDYFETVKKRIDELKLNDYFIFTGQQYNVAEILSILDIFVMSSVNEGFSNAILEAMAAGKPVVAADSGGNPEVVLHEETGLLFKPCDSQSLAEALGKLIDDGELRQSMAEKGRRRVKQYFPFVKMMEKVEELFQYHLFKPGIKTLFMLWLKTVKIYYVKKIIKISLSFLIYYSGFCWIYKRFAGKDVKVLAYHSINNTTFKSLEIEQTRENFESQMRYLKENYCILSLSEFLGYTLNSRKFPRNAVLITFDDGYRDNYINAYPVLKRLNIPAAIFITTEPVETSTPLFYDALRVGIMETKKRILDLEDCGLEKYVLFNNELHLSSVINEITDYSKKLDFSKQTNLINTIFQRLSVDMESILKRKMYLSWDQIREMRDNGIEFGSHTKRHPQLSSISIKDCRTELKESKRIIGEKIGREIRALAYPFGSVEDFNTTVERLSRESGYDAAFSLCSITSTESCSISRKLIDSHACTNLSQSFCKSLFATEMLEIFNKFRIV